MFSETSTNLPVVYVPNACQNTGRESIQEKGHCLSQSDIVPQDTFQVSDLSAIFPDQTVYDTVASQSSRVPERLDDIPDFSEISIFELLPERGMLEELNSEDILLTGQSNLELITNNEGTVQTEAFVDDLLGIANQYPPSNASNTSTRTKRDSDQ